MSISSSYFRGRLAVAGSVVIAAILILLVFVLKQSLFDWFYDRGIFDAREQWEEEARDLAEASAAAEARVSPQDRRRVWRLGFDLGYAAEWLGSFASRGPDGLAEARATLRERAAAMDATAQALGVAPAPVLPVRTVEDFLQIRERIEADETGVAGRIEARFSPRTRHLFLLGMHVGTEWARVSASGGELIDPDRLLIGRHATVAGVPPGIWQPLANRPAGSAGEAALVTYREAIDALERHLCCDAQPAPAS